MILYTYSPWLVALSVLIALMSAFTGLSLTRGLSLETVGRRQVRIVMAAIALGGGIWSMHFVGMLAMRFDVPVYYEVISTVASALIAILLAGLSLILLHFGRRTRGAIALSGAIMGIGIVAMHYVGVSGIEGCLPQQSPRGVAIALVLALGLGILAISIAYGHRTERNILLATLVFGLAVAAVHFSAMAFTSFAPNDALASYAPVMANPQVAILVLLATFVISGAFLLTGAGFVTRGPVLAGVSAPLAFPTSPPLAQKTERIAGGEPPLRLPYEKDGRTHLVPFDAIFALRAEGHYTTVWLDHGPVFCPWSITQAEDRLPSGFLRVHRSWLVNLARVTGYDRAKDHGYCVMAGVPGLDRIPVSRTRITPLREALGL